MPQSYKAVLQPYSIFTEIKKRPFMDRVIAFVQKMRYKGGWKKHVTEIPFSDTLLENLFIFATVE